MTIEPGHAERVAAVRERLARGGYESRTRGLADVDERLAAVGTTLEAAIEDQLRARRPVAVLEIGFGWGPVLIELAWRFRDEPVAFAGINLERKRPVKQAGDLAAVAEALDLVPADRIAEFRAPDVYFYDATNLHFADESLDIVYSAVTLRFIEDKIGVIEEVARVLRPGGRAILDVAEGDWDYPAGAAADPTWLTHRRSYLVLHHDLELVPVRDWLGFAGDDRFTIRVPPGPRCVVDLRKHAPGPLDSGLTLDRRRTMPINRLPAPPDGKPLNGVVRSAYEIAPERFAAFASRRQRMEREVAPPSDVRVR